MKPPYAIGSVPSLSGHAIAYRWRSLPRVRQHRASKAQGSSERVLPWQITMDQLIFASLSHTHYWYEVGMLKVPAVGALQRMCATELPICSPWTFRENHSPNIYTVNRRNQPTAMDLYFLDWVRIRYKTEPETHTKSAHTVL